MEAYLISLAKTLKMHKGHDLLILNFTLFKIYKTDIKLLVIVLFQR